MRHTTKTALLVSVGLCFLLAVLSLLFATEPRYQGKPLSYWARANAGLVEERHYNPEYAIRQIGSKGLPYLLHSATNRPHPWQMRLRAYKASNTPLAKYIPTWMTAEDTETNALAAFRAIECLGPECHSAIPQLVLLALNPTNEYGAVIAAQVLCAIGPKAEPALLQIATNHQALGRYCAIERLTDFKPPYIVPLLLQSLDDPYLAQSAIRCLGRLGQPTDQVIPAIAKVLAVPPADPSFSDTSSIQYTAASTLEQFGQAADAAVPTLLRCLADESLKDNLRGQILKTLATTSLQPHAVLPTLTNYLQGTNDSLSFDAAHALCLMGPRARPALAALTNALQFTNTYTSKMAAKAIRVIVAEAPTNGSGW